MNKFARIIQQLMQYVTSTLLLEASPNFPLIKVCPKFWWKSFPTSVGITNEDTLRRVFKLLIAHFSCHSKVFCDSPSDARAQTVQEFRRQNYAPDHNLRAILFGEYERWLLFLIIFSGIKTRI